MSSDDLLFTAKVNLKKGIEYAVNQIRSKKVNPDTKLRWTRSLTRQVEALVKIAEAEHNIGNKTGDTDLATYLSSLEKKISPSQATMPSQAAKECRRTIKRAIFHVSGFHHATRRHR